MARISVTVNGKRRQADVEPRLLLVHFLREQLRLTGTHVGCDTTQCGACNGADLKGLGPVPGLAGRTAAAPILFDAFARIGAPPAALPRAPVQF